MNGFLTICLFFIFYVFLFILSQQLSTVLVLYVDVQFVSSALKEPGLEFELMHPVLIQRRVIPHFPKAGENAKTIEEEDLVPSALIKFKPLETDSVVFTGLRNELLEISEPLVNG